VDASAQWRDILLAEDSLSDADLMQMSLRDYGHLPCRLHIVPDGEAALAFLRQEGFYAGMPRPHLLLLDIGIPKIDGWEVLETIRATPTLAHMPVIMLTGVLMARDEERRAALQPLACLEKPMKLEEYPRLVAEIEKLLTAISGNR